MEGGEEEEEDEEGREESVEEWGRQKRRGRADNHLEASDTRMTSVSNSSSQAPLSEVSEPSKKCGAGCRRSSSTFVCVRHVVSKL